MKRVALTQRVEVVSARGERRDSLDQRWVAFLNRCGIVPVLLPNNPEIATQLLDSLQIDGLILTGGGNLVEYGGDTPERDATERAVLEIAMARGLPLMGVCRGMQAIQNKFGVRLTPVNGHVAERQPVLVDGELESVNSYHDFGSHSSVPDLEVWAMTKDGVVKAIRHRNFRVEGIMWHPERFVPQFRDADIGRFRRFFGVSE